MGTRFGEKLRLARLEQGLTQADVGRDLYSTSYISLLETGHREPTQEVIEDLAKRLDLNPQAVEAWAAPAEPNAAEFVLAELKAQQAWDVHEYGQAAVLAQEAAEIASRHNNVGAWWKMSFLRAECLREDGDFAACRALAEEILEYPLSLESAELTVRTQTLLATTCQGLGLLNEAFAHASQAVENAEQLAPVSTFQIEALFALIAALAESDRFDEAWVHCRKLSALIDISSPSIRAGTAYWAIGNVAFMRQDPEEGLRYHQLAAEHLSPVSDLELWARFNKASAAMRLTAEIVGADTLVCIEKAELATSIVGASRGIRLELSLLRAEWLFLNHEYIAATNRLHKIYDQRDALARQTVGEAALLLGQCYSAQHNSADALRYLDKAHTSFTEAGSPERAAHTAQLQADIKAA